MPIRSVIVALLIVVCSSVPASAAPGEVVITEVTVSVESGELIISGRNFDQGAPPVVTLGERGTLAITSAGPGTIVAALPGELPAGTYRLAVSTGSAPHANDAFPVTVGAVGPPGEPGGAPLTEAEVEAYVGNGFLQLDGPVQVDGKLYVGGFQAADQEELRVYGDAKANNLLVGGHGFLSWPFYGGGFFMTDTSWVRILNNKGLMTSGTVEAGVVKATTELRVDGPIIQRGGTLHADYVFDPGYRLESIEAHAAQMWKDKHLSAIPPRRVDDAGVEVLDVGAHRRGMLEELEKAHRYIEQLNAKLSTQEQTLLEVRGKLQQLTEELSTTRPSRCSLTE